MSRGAIHLEPAEPLRSALAALQQTTGLMVSLTANHVSEHDSKMSVTTGDGRIVELVCEVKASIDRHDQLSTFKYQHGNAVLVTRALTSAMIEQCRQINIQFLDTAGNCYLNQPGLFVFVSGRKDIATPRPTATRGLTPAALRLMFALLGKPSLINSNVRRIAEIAGISHGAAGTAIVMLENIGLISKSAAGQRMLMQPGRWLDMWTEGYLGRLRPKLQTYRMRSSTSLSAVLDRVSPAMGEIMLGGRAAVAGEIILGGEAAAAAKNLNLKPGAMTVYLDLRNANVMQDLVQELKLRRDPDGNIELVEIFWNTRELPSFPTVPDALIYADLIGSGDERNLEIATQLRKRIVDDVASET